MELGQEMRPADKLKPLDELVNTASSAALLEQIESRLEQERGFSVATLNLDHVVKLRRSSTFRDAYARHTHVVADGNPIVWLLLLAGRRVQLAPGSELVEPIAEMAARLDVPIALFGSSDDSLALAGQALCARYEGLRIVAHISPPMGFDPEGQTATDAIAELEATGARIVFLALGAPKQEVFAVRAQDVLHQTGFLSIGAGLDFLSGRQTRAPKLVRLLAAEWLWRLAQNPLRLARRYGACIAILPGLGLSAVGRRFATRNSGLNE